MRPPPPAIYDFFDWGTDWQTLHPEYGAIGSEHMILWQQINPAPGVFNWSRPDADLAREAELKVTLRDGSTIPKPVVIRVSFFLSAARTWSCPGVIFWDGTPRWVYEEIDRKSGLKPRPTVCGRKVGHVVGGCGLTAVVPMWDNPIWRQRYYEMVRALGAHYGDNPQVAAVVIETGLDGETHMGKAIGDCDWEAIIGARIRGIRWQFEQFFIPQAIRAYREAFPHTLVLISNTAGGSAIRLDTSRLAASLSPPVGIKNCGAWVDQPNHQGYGNNVGIFDMPQVYSDTVPIWIETKFGMGDPESRYWTWLAMLHYHPVGVDVHEAWINESDPAWLRFVQDHLGRTLADTPDVWCALRDTEYPAHFWGANGEDGESGHVGDWTFWLTRLENAPGNRTVRLWKQDLPATCQDQVYSRQARRTDQASGNPYMSFDIADGCPYAGHKPLSEPGGTVGYRVTLTLLNQGDDTFSVQYRNWAGQLVARTVQKGPSLGPVGRWVEVTLDLQDAYLNNNLPGGADLRLSCNDDGDEAVHLIRISGHHAGDPLPTPPTRPSPTATFPGRPTLPVGTPSSSIRTPPPKLVPGPS